MKWKLEGKVWHGMKRWFGFVWFGWALCLLFSSPSFSISLILCFLQPNSLNSSLSFFSLLWMESLESVFLFVSICMHGDKRSVVWCGIPKKGWRCWCKVTKHGFGQVSCIFSSTGGQANYKKSQTGSDSNVYFMCIV